MQLDNGFYLKKPTIWRNWHDERSVIPSPDQSCFVYRTGGPISPREDGPGEGLWEEGGQSLAVGGLSPEFPAGAELDSRFALFVAGSLRI